VPEKPANPDQPPPDPFRHAAARLARVDPTAPEIPEELRRPVDAPEPDVIKWKHDPNASKDTSGMMKAFALGLNFTYGVIGMGLLGWILQRWVFPGGAPWVLLGCLFAGLIAGMYLFIREANRVNRA